MKTFGTAMIDAIKWGLSAVIDVNNFINEQIVTPFADGVMDSISGGILMDNAKALGTSMIEQIKTGVTETIPNFIMNEIASPLATMITTTDWGGVLDGLVAKGGELVDALIEGVAGVGAAVWAVIQSSLNEAIPNSVGINIKIPNPLGGNLYSGGVNVDLPDNPFMSGTPWTGSMPRNQAAGIVHGKEAVIPTGGMMARVVPSPDGLMVQGGGGRGGGINIGTVNVYGVEDVQSLTRQIQREIGRQSAVAGVW